MTYTTFTNCVYDHEGKKMIHIWTYSGDPDCLLREGTRCDCGEVEWHETQKMKKVIKKKSGKKQ